MPQGVEHLTANPVKLGSVKKIDQVDDLDLDQPSHGAKDGGSAQGGVVATQRLPQLIGGKALSTSRKKAQALGHQVPGPGSSFPQLIKSRLDFLNIKALVFAHGLRP